MKKPNGFLIISLLVFVIVRLLESLIDMPSYLYKSGLVIAIILGLIGILSDVRFKNKI